MRFLLLLGLLLPALATAQSVTGTIFGTVRDATGAAIRATSVVLTETSTGFSRIVATDEGGAYAAPLLATGEYTIRVQVTGFKTESVTGIVIGVDQKVRVDVDLTIGDVSDAVVVEGRNPLVQRAASDLSATLDGAEMQALPLNGRNFVQLARTMPGVVRGVPGENIDGSSSIAWRGSASLSANGQRNRDNNFLLDGLDNNEVWLNTVAIYPNVDALDELKVQTGIYAAEFGRSLGRRGEPADEVGRQHAPWKRVRVPARRRAGRERLVQQPGRTAEAGLQPPSVRRRHSADRSSGTGRSSSATTRDG